MNRQIPRNSVVSPVIVLLVLGAVKAKAQDDLSGLGVIYVAGVGVIAAGTSAAFAIGNNYLVNRDRGNVLLGAGGMLVGMPTALMGLAIILGGAVSGAPVAALPGILVTCVGWNSMIAGAKSIKQARRSESRLSMATLSVTPGIFSGDGHKADYGLQMRIVF